MYRGRPSTERPTVSTSSVRGWRLASVRSSALSSALLVSRFSFTGSPSQTQGPGFGGGGGVAAAGVAASGEASRAAAITRAAERRLLTVIS